MSGRLLSNIEMGSNGEELTDSITGDNSSYVYEQSQVNLRCLMMIMMLMMRWVTISADAADAMGDNSG